MQRAERTQILEDIAVCAYVLSLLTEQQEKVEMSIADVTTPYRSCKTYETYYNATDIPIRKGIFIYRFVYLRVTMGDTAEEDL